MYLCSLLYPFIYVGRQIDSLVTHDCSRLTVIFNWGQLMMGSVPVGAWDSREVAAPGTDTED